MPMLRTLVAGCVTLFVLLGTGNAQTGTKQPYLTIELKQSQVAGTNTQTIEIQSWSCGDGTGSTQPPRTGPGTLRVEAPRSALSDDFARWQREGTRLPVVRLVSENTREPFVITMKGATITSAALSGSSGDVPPMDLISLNFTTIEFD